jgi:AcrR family transcriptional regulator
MTTDAADRAERRLPLSRDRVLRAAVSLADSHGIGALTMRRLGQALGVEAMSLYKHVRNKDDVLDGVVELVLAEVDLPEPGEAWKPAMRRRATSARAVFARHPWATTLVQSRATPGPATLRYYDAVVGSLRAGGFPVALAAHAFAVLDSYVYGFAVQERSLPMQAPGELAEVTGDILASFPAEQFPHLAEMAVEHILQPGYDYADEFGWGLELILDALERAL